ncbi:MAG: HEAT repeat domain-containing protein [Deltaproteobacteria bacterium]|nr:HEAT repeat domain-containing protein [Deltaproteobacteria bacterium]MDQ3299136.1 HEAT repeat domain-containing protein [Myxococcota bacterium]
MRRFLAGLAGLVLSASAPHAASAWTFDWAGHVEVDAENLSSDDPQKRLEAVSELGKYDIALTERHLMRALADTDDKVKVAAAKALGQGGSIAAVPVMIEWLSDSDPKIRQEASRALGEIGGAEAATALTRSLGDIDDGVRQQTVKALGTIGRKGNTSVVLALIPRLEDAKSEVRLATIQQLEELGDRRAVIPLVARFADTTPSVRRQAVSAVGKLGDRSAVPALIRLMNDPTEDVRTAAVGSLGNLGAIDAIDALTEQLTSGSQAFRQKVAYALGQIAGRPGAGKAGEEAMRTLVIQLQKPEYRQGAKEALRVAGKAAVPALVLHLQGRIDGEPATAVELLGEAADARATATLAAELERGRVAMPKVLRALGATGDPQALVPVLRALASKDSSIRLAAMESMRPLVVADARAGDVLLEHLADEDLEIRVLAAEYLGIVKLRHATPKLAALAGPGNPPRLRRAAIDALGEIGRPEATKALIAVLRDGPVELHKSAATALSYIADPAAIPLLVTQVQTDRRPSRHEVVRALGATLRVRPDPAARKLLRDLAQDASVRVGLAAIAGLAAAKNPADAPLLRGLVENAPSDRRRAAAWALGEMRDTGSLDVLATALSSREDRLAGDAAWALGEIIAANPKHARANQLVDRWLHAGKHGAWATSINSTAALARLLWATPPGPSGSGRADLVGFGANKELNKARRNSLLGLVFHKSRLVRINAAHALAAMPPDDDVLKALDGLVRDDVSPHVRVAAVHALARVGGPKAAAALKLASNDADPEVRAAALAVAQTAPPPPPARTEWRVFYVVDPSADDAAVRQEQYFVHTADSLVWASYTDARGELTSEHVPPGEIVVWPASRESEY